MQSSPSSDGAEMFCPKITNTERSISRVAGTSAAARWDEQKELAIRQACRPHGISAIGEAALHRVQKDYGFSRKPLATPRNYTAHQLANAIGRSRKAVEVQLKRMASFGLATLIKPGDRGRGHAAIWELPIIGPTFGEVVAEGRKRGHASHRSAKAKHSSRGQNGRPVPLSPEGSKKNTYSPRATPKGPSETQTVAMGAEEQALVEAAVAAGAGKGGAVVAIKALKGTSPDRLKVLAKHISQVLEAIRKEPSTVCPFKVFVSRCKDGRGKDLVDLALRFEAAERAAEAAKPAPPPPPATAAELQTLSEAWIAAKRVLEASGTRSQRRKGLETNPLFLAEACSRSALLRALKSTRPSLQVEAFYESEIRRQIGRKALMSLPGARLQVVLENCNLAFLRDCGISW